MLQFFVKVFSVTGVHQTFLKNRPKPLTKSILQDSGRQFVRNGTFTKLIFDVSADVNEAG